MEEQVWIRSLLALARAVWARSQRIARLAFAGLSVSGPVVAVISRRTGATTRDGVKAAAMAGGA